MSHKVGTWLRVVGSLAAGTSLAASASHCADAMNDLRGDGPAWRSDVLPAQLPAARGNAFADRDDAALLGMKIFYDNRFSRPGSGVSCASCHDPEHSFSELKPRSHTLREVARNAPDLINAAWYTKSHFWDGKVDNLWSAPLFTFEQSDEMGASRLQVVHGLAAVYQTRYEKIFGPLPDLSDTKRFPESGKPGAAAFDGMSADDRQAVNQVYANIGKALEAYIRKLAAGRAPFDDFVAGSQQALTPAAQRGMTAFAQLQCQSCHSGPLFSDEDFHSLNMQAATAEPHDPGRAGSAAFLTMWEFGSSSPFADSPPSPGQARTTGLQQQSGFRTPSLRNVAMTPPYGHDGSFATLEQVIDAHAAVLPESATLGPQDKEDIVEFLRSLSGRPPQRPWNYWPGG